MEYLIFLVGAGIGVAVSYMVAGVKKADLIREHRMAMTKEIEDGAIEVRVVSGELTHCRSLVASIENKYRALQAVRNEATSPRVVRLAARGMRNPKSLDHSEVRSVCASCVTQYEKKGKKK